MNKKVVVENTLKSHIAFLEESGYDVHKLYRNENAGNITSFEYDGIVVNDLNDISINSSTNYRPGSPIIEAKGKTPEEIYNLLRSRY